MAQTDELSPVGLPSISPHLLTPVLIKSTEMRTISLSLFSLFITSSVSSDFFVCERMTASKRVMPFCASVHSSLMWCCQLLMRAKQRERQAEPEQSFANPHELLMRGIVGSPAPNHTRMHAHTIKFTPRCAKVFRTHTEGPWLHADKQMDKQQNIHISTF